MNRVFKYRHIHPGISKAIIETQLENLCLEDGVHKIVLKNDHFEPSACVKISIFDPRVFWAFRGSRKYPSPMISLEDAKEIGMVQTNDITVVIEKKGDTYKIITCYVGFDSPKEPSTANAGEYDECVKFWTYHALVPDERIRKTNKLEEMPQWVIEAYLRKEGS